MRGVRLIAGAGGLCGVALAAALSLGAADDPVGTLPEGLRDPELLEGEARIEVAVAEKLARWRERREAACRNRAYDEAVALADSMILDYARARALQLERPGRPDRPEAPPLRRPSDTLTLAPFLRDTL